jgi:hypothetical protein
MRRTLVLLALVAAACARSPHWSYHPTTDHVKLIPGRTVADHAAVRYPLPRGEVTIATVGIVPITPADNPDGSAEPMLQVRMVVHNADATLWTVSAPDQVVDIDGVGRRLPRFASCDGQDLGVAVLQPGDTRTIDLYYELPWIQLPKDHPPAIGVDWRVRTPAQVIARAETQFAPAKPRPAPKPPKARKVAVVTPPPDPHQMARALDGAPRDGHRSDGAALPPPSRGDIAGGLGR